MSQLSILDPFTLDVVPSFVARSLCVKLVPDVLLLDLSMPALDPTTTVATIRAKLPQIKVIILSAHNTLSYVRSMTEANVDGYVLKDDAPEDVVQAVRAVARDEVWYSQAVVQKILALKRPELCPNEAQLNMREQKILTLIANGWNNAQIAAELDLAEQTVKNYLSNIYRTIKVSTRTGAIIWAIREGFSSPGESFGDCTMQKEGWK